MNAATQNRLFAEDGVTTEPVISVRGLRTAFGDHVVHDNLDLTVFRGEIMVLVGGSGTARRCCCGRSSAWSGRRPVPCACWASPVRARAGRAAAPVVPLGHAVPGRALFSALSVDNVALPLRELRAIPEDLVHDVVMCRLAMVGLSAQDAGKRPSDLSGGMVKRVALARALSLDPELVFLDEPTAGLDPLRSDEFVDLVRSLHRQLGFTVVMVTHDLDTLLALATRVAVLADKRVIVCDTVPEVLKFDHPFIHTFFWANAACARSGTWRRRDCNMENRSHALMAGIFTLVLLAAAAGGHLDRTGPDPAAAI